MPRPGAHSYLLSQAQRRLGDYKAAEEAARRAHRPEQPEPVGLLRARRSARRAAPVSGRRRRAGPVRQQKQGAPIRNDCGRAAAAAPRVRVSGARAARQGDRHVRRGAQARAERSGGGRLSDPGATSPPRSTGGRRARARGAAEHPDDLRLARLEAQALRQAGKSDQGIAVLEEAVQKHADEPTRTSRWRRCIRTPTAAPGGQGAAGRAGEVPDRHVARLRARRRLDKQKKIRGSRRRRSSS